MYSSIQRLQYITNQSITVLFVITLFIIVSSYAQLYTNGFLSVPVEFDTSNWRVLHLWKSTRNFGANTLGSRRQPKENIKVDKLLMEADLTPLFNYNTKQVFVYLTYLYQGYNEQSESKVTLWDKIIRTPEELKLDLKLLKSKYSCWDYAANFTSSEGVLSLEWNIQPQVGFLLWGETSGSYPVEI